MKKLYIYIFAREYFRSFNTKLLRLVLNTLGILNYENNQISGEDFFLRKILPKYIISRNPVFFDVGANEGDYSLLISKLYKNCSISAFEPNAKTNKRLEIKVKGTNIKVQNLALAAKEGSGKLFDRLDYDGSSHASLYEDVITKIHKQNLITQDIIIDTVDNFCEKMDIKHVDFIKIDTEGNELSVLQGAQKMLSEKKVGCIQIEFNEMNVISRTFFRDFMNLLSDYRLYRLLPNGIIELNDCPLETELFAFQNIVAIKK